MGRPLGKKSTMKRFRDYVSEEDAVRLIESAMRLAQGGDRDMLKYCLDHYLGKAPQAITDGDGENLQLVGFVYEQPKAQEQGIV